ncbi:MAG: hypothetical protein M1832_000279 [Thelocarpon impressellum]|nr:MAG: hypothetical protein M1832_000279 [Thelocarpon impressellum]
MPYVNRFRSRAAVPYPCAYASAEAARTSPEAYAFNCVQRAHGNFMEHHPTALMGLLIAGLRYPLAASALGAAWIVGRVLFAVGYANSPMDGKGRGRYRGFFALPAEAALVLLAGWVSVGIITS